MTTHHHRCRLRLKCDSTRAETRFRLSAKRTSPFKLAGASVQSTTGSRGVRISGSNAGYTMFRGRVKGTDYPHHSPVYPSLPPSPRHRVPSNFNWSLQQTPSTFHMYFIKQGHTTRPISTMHNLTAPWPVKKFTAIYVRRRFITVFTRHRHLSIPLEPRQSIPRPHNPISCTPVLILSSLLCICLPICRFPSGLAQSV